MQNMQLEDVFTTEQLMTRYAVSRRTIYRWINAGRFNAGRGYFQLDDGQYRVYQSAIQAHEDAKLKKITQPTKRKYTRRTEAERVTAKPKRKYTRRSA